MLKSAISILVLSLIVATTTGVQPPSLALLAAVLVTVGAITRVHRSNMAPRLSGGLMTWALRQHGF